MEKPILLTVPAFEDFRGYLAVLYDRSVDFTIRQINQGYSKKAFTLRGLHFQEGEHTQAKLVSCLRGSIFNVALDLRPGETFGHAYSAVLSFENRKQMLIPRGFAHGYLTLEDDTLMQWCVDNDFCGEAAKAVRFDDPDMIWESAESWPTGDYIISEKDKNAMSLKEAVFGRYKKRYRQREPGTLQKMQNPGDRAAAERNLPETSARSSLPCEKNVCFRENSVRIHVSAKQLRRVRQRKNAVEELLRSHDEQHLWKCVVAFQGYRFETISGLPFSYRLKPGRNGELTRELWIDRRTNSKSLTWSSVLMVFGKTAGKPVVERPKALGDIRGVSYIYGIFLRFGLIEVPRKKTKSHCDTGRTDL